MTPKTATNEPPRVLLSLLVLTILRFLAHSLALLGHESAASVAGFNLK